MRSRGQFSGFSGNVDRDDVHRGLAVPQRDRLRIEFRRLARKELRKVRPLFRKTNSGGAGREVDARLEEFLVGTSLGGNDGAGKPGETERGASD